MNSTHEQIPASKKWLVAIRPFSFPASTVPVIFGTVLAVVVGGAKLNPLFFGLALMGMVILHSASNILSDITDYNKGLDKVPTPVSGAIVRGMLSTKTARKGAILLFVVGSLIGLLLAWLTTPMLLVIGGVGVLIGVLYTLGGVFALKYHALGDLAVFLNFGILGSLGAWMVQTGTFSWIPVIWAIPVALLVAGILHANNWRDMASDKECRVVTLAGIFKDKGSLVYYAFLLFMPFVFVIFMVTAPRLFPGLTLPMPFSFFITLLALPMAVKLFNRARRRKNPENPMDFIALDGATAQLNLLFGLLSTGALLLNLVI